MAIIKAGAEENGIEVGEYIRKRLFSTSPWEQVIRALGNAPVGYRTSTIRFNEDASFTCVYEHIETGLFISHRHSPDGTVRAVFGNDLTGRLTARYILSWPLDERLSLTEITITGKQGDRQLVLRGTVSQDGGTREEELEIYADGRPPFSRMCG